MLAWTKTSDAAAGLTLRDVPDPVPLPHEVVVRVDAFAPNPGDLAALPGASAGTIPGWDGSGVVTASAADGSGPDAGERVIFLALAARSWAQLVAVPAATTATAPPDASPAHLATLPVPATSALRALRRFGSVLGRRVLIVGATSAVGRFAVQLASRSGARVIAVARDELQHAALRALGASETHSTVGSVAARVHGAMDMIGGQHLVDAYAALAPGATVIALGHSAGADELFPYGALVADTTTSDRTLTSFFLGSEPHLAEEMTYLAHGPALDVGELDIRPWTELSKWIDAGARRDSGRAVFRVSPAGAV
jgi:NADPH:quinone reductase-like Zn-dependent oxidoreductase